MAVRIVCPSCSATLSVKDEFAGRAVKCPKCGGVIPPAPESAVPPPLPPAIETADQPAPAASEPMASGERDDSDRPRRDRDDRDRRDRRDRDDRDRRDGRDRDDDRRRRARRREEDDRGPPQNSGGSGTGKVLAILAIVGVLCCGGIGGAVYWFVIKVKETVEQVKDNLERSNWLVTVQNYDRLQVGTTTRAQADTILGGKSRVATADDLVKVFPPNFDNQKMEAWVEKVAQSRAVIWQNGDDYLIAAFHPNAEAGGRLQAKEWRPRSGANRDDGEMDDIVFLKEYPPGKFTPPKGKEKDDEPPAGAVLPVVTAEELAQAFKDNEAAANTKYKDKWLIVDGKLHDVMTGTNSDEAVGVVEGAKALMEKDNLHVRCFARIDESNKVWNVSRGQSVRFKGKCTGGGSLQTFVALRHCRVESTGPDPSVNVTAAMLIAEFSNAKTADAANAKYKDKEVTVTGAVFESVAGDLANFTMTPKKGQPIRIQVNFTFGLRDKLAKLKPGDRVKFKANCGGLFDKTIAMYRGYLVP